MLGMTSEQAAGAPSIEGMVSSVTGSLGVTNTQANGGLGAIFSYAKDNISSDQYQQLATALPGIGGLLASAPDISSITSDGGLGGF
jgi:hypothetical protein